jgi:hypothetical protein
VADDDDVAAVLESFESRLCRLLRQRRRCLRRDSERGREHRCKRRFDMTAPYLPGEATPSEGETSAVVKALLPHAILRIRARWARHDAGDLPARIV